MQQHITIILFHPRKTPIGCGPGSSCLLESTRELLWEECILRFNRRSYWVLPFAGVVLWCVCSLNMVVLLHRT